MVVTREDSDDTADNNVAVEMDIEGGRVKLEYDDDDDDDDDENMDSDADDYDDLDDEVDMKRRIKLDPEYAPNAKSS